MKKVVKIAIALAIGFAIGIILIAVAIYYGYADAYSTGVGQLTVKILGMPIYELTKTGTEYAGSPAPGIYKGAVCGTCMLASLAVEEIISRVRGK